MIRVVVLKLAWGYSKGTKRRCHTRTLNHILFPSPMFLGLSTALLEHPQTAPQIWSAAPCFQTLAHRYFQCHSSHKCWLSHYNLFRPGSNILWVQDKSIARGPSTGCLHSKFIIKLVNCYINCLLHPYIDKYTLTDKNLKIYVKLWFLCHWK